MQKVVIVLAAVLLGSCGQDTSQNETAASEPEEVPADVPAADSSDTSSDEPEDEPGVAIDFDLSEADMAYLNSWMEQQEDFVASLKWLPHFIHEQGELGICLRLEFEGEQAVDGALVEAIRAKIEERVWQWQRGLVGEEHWVRNERTPVRLFGVAATPQAQLTEMPDVPVYINDAAECPFDCFRFNLRDQEAPLFEDCTHPTMSHFDFQIWYSDFSFGAAGHGGDWGTRLDWNLFLQELTSDTPTVTDHELGHVAGLPDLYTFPLTLDGHERPSAIMATDGAIRDFDYVMLRKVWELGWSAFYAD